VNAALRALAREYGVLLRYRGANGVYRNASDDAVLGVLRALGAPLRSEADAPDALRARAAERWRRVVEPVSLGSEPLTLRVPARDADEPVEIELALEDGVARVARTHAEATDKEEIDGESFVERRAPWPGDIPFGYHRARVRCGASSGETLLVVAPERAPAWDERAWGIFTPLYALRTARAWDTADLTDLAALGRWTAGMGGRVVQTLPLLSMFCDGEDAEPSPYSPVSRLFWNELYADVERAEELGRSDEARALLASASFRAEIAAARAQDTVDYAAAYARKRRVLDLLARAWPDDARAKFESETPHARAYAEFRAARETANAHETPDAARAHLYAQHLTMRQLAAFGRDNTALVFDLPLGVHPRGFDASNWSDDFAPGVATGAPPDAFFADGQNWSFSPLHPERIREDGYAYPIACLRNLLRYARVLRVDHVMGLHRLWWIPPGASARDGAYVRYNANEWYAILVLEAHRAGSVLVGEDLGTVPNEVRREMARRDVNRTYVVQHELTPKRLNPVPAASLATLGTHDMPMFATFWRALGAAARTTLARALGIAPDARARDAMRAALVKLGASPARAVVASIEDLWEETEPQNVPGTEQSANWRRKGRYPLEEFAAVAEPLRALDAARKSRRGERR
jgi:4-alpha-glucanotransferase